jgi:hypothetical protein
MKKAELVVIVLVASFSGVGALGESPLLHECFQRELKDVHLTWRPTDPIASPKVVTLRPGATTSAAAPLGTTVRVEVQPLADSLTNPLRIGENRGDLKETCIYAVSTKEDAAAWTTDRLRYVLSELGVQVVAHDGDLILSGELRRFYVVETGTYDGEVAFRLDLTSKAGKVLWSGLVRGTNGHWGKSFKPENYQETLSNSLIDAVQQLLSNRDFSTVLNAGN